MRGFHLSDAFGSPPPPQFRPGRALLLGMALWGALVAGIGIGGPPLAWLVVVAWGGVLFVGLWMALLAGYALWVNRRPRPTRGIIDSRGRAVSLEWRAGHAWLVVGWPSAVPEQPVPLSMWTGAYAERDVRLVRLGKEIEISAVFAGVHWLLPLRAGARISEADWCPARFGESVKVFGLWRACALHLGKEWRR